MTRRVGRRREAALDLTLGWGGVTNLGEAAVAVGFLSALFLCVETKCHQKHGWESTEPASLSAGTSRAAICLCCLSRNYKAFVFNEETGSREVVLWSSLL